jgi:fatty acyl-CoA reductase
MNLVGTKRVVELCKELKNLKAFVHVSTAYANCDRTTINEEVYKSPIEPNKLIEMLDLIDDNLANYISPIVIKPKPNTYTYTKAIAESLVVQECGNGPNGAHLPTCIVRPSIITASWREPFPGWIGKYKSNRN